MLQITRTGKQAARQLILDLFDLNAWSQPLKILTMPGVSWEFERALLTLREPGWMLTEKPHQTFITGVEHNPSRFQTSLRMMPGISTPDALIVRSQFTFARRAVTTHFAHFYLTYVQSFLLHRKCEYYDAVWLDFSGPLTITDLTDIADYFSQRRCKILIITALKARWNKFTNAAIRRAGNHSKWLNKSLHGSVLHDIEYFDTSPMAQLCICQPAMMTRFNQEGPQ